MDIELKDVVTGNGRATYSIKIDQGGKTLSDDPEIENKHKVGTVTVTRGVTNVN